MDYGLAGRVLISDDSGEGTRMADPEYALIKAIAGGDQEAFERLVKRYQSPLYNFVYRHLGDRALAEDVTQETFLQIYRSAPRFERSASLHLGFQNCIQPLVERERTTLATATPGNPDNRRTPVCRWELRCRSGEI